MQFNEDDGRTPIPVDDRHIHLLMCAKETSKSAHRPRHCLYSLRLETEKTTRCQNPSKIGLKCHQCVVEPKRIGIYHSFDNGSGWRHLPSPSFMFLSGNGLNMNILKHRTSIACLHSFKAVNWNYLLLWIANSHFWCWKWTAVTVRLLSSRS